MSYIVPYMKKYKNKADILYLPYFMKGGKKLNVFDPNTMARIHSFETFGAVDGPGIRFVIFFQGCHLKCKYCQNRDTWDCDSGSIYTIEQVIEKIQRYENYILPSGGVTATGGEPLLQASFLVSLFSTLKKKRISTAIDTSGIVKITKQIEEVVKVTDLFLLDIKCINDKICKQLVGVSNQKELEFANYLNKKQKEIWIRQVIIPGVTDKEEDLNQLKQFLSNLTCVTKVELLPYHSMGKYKWEKLGKQYPLESVRDATEKDIKRAREILGR